MTSVLLVLNASSSSLKFQVFAFGGTADPRRIFKGVFEELSGSPHLLIRDGSTEGPVPLPGSFRRTSR